MLLLVLYLAANILMAFMAWRAYARYLYNRNREFLWTFQNTINLFIYWAFITGCFKIAFFNTHSAEVFLANSAQLLIFLALVKIGTMEYNFSCGHKEPEPQD